MEKGLFIDLDNTLLDKNLCVSERNILSIKKAIDRGYKLIVVTGRPYKFVRFLTDKINSEIDIISFNGAFSDKIIDLPIDEADVLSLYELFCENKIKVMFKTIDHVFANYEINKLFLYKTSNNQTVDFSEFCQKKDLINKKVYKISGIYTDEESNLNKMLQNFKISLNFYKGKGFEIINSKIDKGKAVEIYCKQNNISLKESYFFGDDINDISMFKLGGKNIIMNNAEDDIKKYAYKISDNCENDGVGKMIDEILGEFENGR